MRGRPTKYKPEFCELIEKHLASGFSLESFGAIAGTHKETIYEWQKQHPSFSEAIKRGRAKQSLWYEERLQQIGMGAFKDANVTAIIWLTKNMLKWTDKSEVALTGANGGPVRFSDLTEAEIDKRIKNLVEEFLPSDDEE